MAGKLNTRPQINGKVEKQKYTCVCCGKPDLTEDNFYSSINSHMWNTTNHRPLFCRKCIDKEFNVLSDRYGERDALIAICAILDLPFLPEVYNNIITNNNAFYLSKYTSILNGTQYRKKSFINTIIEGNMDKDRVPVEELKERRLNKEETKSKNEVLNVIGYDPFEGYPVEDRGFLFNELVKYLDDDVADDPYKLSQIVQICNNNSQIRKWDLLIAKADPVNDSDTIKKLSKMKTELVTSNDKIAKENEISVKNRSNKDVGKSTLTYLMRDLREKDFKKAEANYYDQLRSEGTLWAISMSNRSIRENGMFDENDQNEMFNTQRELIQKLQAQLDDELEKNRLLTIENKELKKNGDKK